MSSEHRRIELKAFLRARRAAISPEELGIPRGVRRLTPGLRREEVAAAAGVGVTWYTWLEQGRDIRPSPVTLRHLARALRLNAADESYLFSLAGVPYERSHLRTVAIPNAIQSALNTYAGPAAVLSSMFDMLAANRMARMLYEEPGTVGPYPQNQMWQLFMNPARRQLYLDYEHDAQHFVGLFRLSAAAQLENPRFQTLVSALLQASVVFAKLWKAQRIDPPAPRTVRLFHEAFGSMDVHSVRLPVPTMDDAFILMAAPANDATAAAFARVAARLNTDSQVDSREAELPTEAVTLSLNAPVSNAPVSEVS